MWAIRRVISLRNFLDSLHDRRVCGISLERCIPSPFEESRGIVDTISTPYASLEAVFESESFSKDDILLDVGCGLGRPLAYLEESEFAGQLVGVEINQAIATQTEQWAKRYDNIRIICAGAFDMDITPFTKYFMWYSMLPATFEKYLRKVENEAIRPLRFYYIGNSGQAIFENSPHWTLARNGCIERVLGIPQPGNPLRYGIWDFDPGRR